MPLEAVAATLSQEGRSANEDAFAIRAGDPPWIAIADGAGNAEQAAKRVLRGFEQMAVEARADPSGAGLGLAAWPTWDRGLRALDAGSAGGSESTFAGVALVDERLVGAVVGDSRVYVWRRDGALEWVSAGAGKHRLGSGGAQPFPLHLGFERGDLVLLLTDGAWSPMSTSHLQVTIARSALSPLAEVADRILALASRGGRGDDMTVVVGRRR
jgi:serine/threonine protein phosphatase PrpC